MLPRLPLPKILVHRVVLHVPLGKTLYLLKMTLPRLARGITLPTVPLLLPLKCTAVNRETELTGPVNFPCVVNAFATTAAVIVLFILIIRTLSPFPVLPILTPLTLNQA